MRDKIVLSVALLLVLTASVAQAFKIAHQAQVIDAQAAQIGRYAEECGNRTDAPTTNKEDK